MRIFLSRVGNNGYVYNQVDGKDTIYNYRSEDKIVITTKGKVNPKSNGKDVTLSIGEKGKIVLSNAAGKDIQYVVNGQATLYSSYDVDASNDVDVAWFLEDEDDFSDADNQLSSIIRDGAASSYSTTGFDDTFTFAAKNSSLPALTYSSKK